MDGNFSYNNSGPHNSDQEISSNHSDVSSTYYYYGFETVVSLSTILVITMIVAVVGNCLVILTILRNRDMRTRTNLLLCNLALADILVSVTDIPVAITTLIAGDWKFSQNLCDFNGYLVGMGMMLSIHTLMWISIHKFISITRPFAELITQNKIWCMIVAAWTWSLLYNLGPLVGWTNTVYKRGASQCGPEVPKTGLQVSHSLTNTIVNFIIPMSVMSYCYYKIFAEVREHLRRLQDFSDSTMHAKYLQQKRISLTLFIVLMCFVLCWFPYIVYSCTLVAIGEAKMPPIFNPLAYVCSYINSACNPIIYALRSPTFRKGFKEILCGSHRGLPEWQAMLIRKQKPIATNRQSFASQKYPPALTPDQTPVNKGNDNTGSIQSRTQLLTSKSTPTGTTVEKTPRCMILEIQMNGDLLQAYISSSFRCIEHECLKKIEFDFDNVSLQFIGSEDVYETSSFDQSFRWTSINSFAGSFRRSFKRKSKSNPVVGVNKCRNKRGPKYSFCATGPNQELKTFRTQMVHTLPVIRSKEEIFSENKELFEGKNSRRTSDYNSECSLQSNSAILKTPISHDEELENLVFKDTEEIVTIPVDLGNKFKFTRLLSSSAPSLLYFETDRNSTAETPATSSAALQLLIPEITINRATSERDMTPCSSRGMHSSETSRRGIPKLVWRASTEKINFLQLHKSDRSQSMWYTGSEGLLNKSTMKLSLSSALISMKRSFNDLFAAYNNDQEEAVGGTGNYRQSYIDSRTCHVSSTETITYL